jgi:hypothetical protein
MRVECTVRGYTAPADYDVAHARRCFMPVSAVYPRFIPDKILRYQQLATHPTFSLCPDSRLTMHTIGQNQRSVES